MIKEIHGSRGGSAKSKKILQPVVNGWRKAMRRYAEIDEGSEDAGYFYNERANIGFLAAGAWLSGGAALEEYNSQKYRNRKKSSGRVDLYVCTKDRKSIEIEAKLKWLKAHFRDAQLEKHVRDKLKMAEKAARALEGNWNRYACVFYVSQFRIDQFEDYENGNALLIRNHIKKQSRAQKNVYGLGVSPPIRDS